MDFFPTNKAPTRISYYVNPSRTETQHINTTVDMVKAWIGDSLYDNTLSVADNIVQAIANNSFPTAYPITLRGVEFSLRTNEEIFFPENVTLKDCNVHSGKASFYHGNAYAFSNATVIACGFDAEAYAQGRETCAIATASGARATGPGERARAYATASGSSAYVRGYSAVAYAIVSGSTAIAPTSNTYAIADVSGATAEATFGGRATANASGATANATRGGLAIANASGAVANATGEESVASAEAYGAIANASAPTSTATAKASGATANATVNGAEAYATVSGATASATADGSQAFAQASGTIANATFAGAVAVAATLDSIAIARHGLALTPEEAKQGKVIPYSEFMIINENLDRFCDMNNSSRADAAYAVGMAFCDGKGVTQSDTLATFFLSAAHELAHRYAAFELGELYSKKRTWFRRDKALADLWYSKETADARRVRELAPKYALLFQSLHENESALHGVPKDVIKVIGNLLGKL
jgi:hypothetical protein